MAGHNSNSNSNFNSNMKATTELLLILACVSIASGVTTLTFNPPYAPVGETTYANCSTTDIDSIANVRTIKFKLNGLEKYRVDLDCSRGNMIDFIDSGMSGRMSYADGLTSFRWDRLELVDSGQLYSCEVRHCASAALYASGNAELIVFTRPTGVSISPDVINAEEAKPLSTTITCTADVGGPSGALRLLLNNTVDLKMETTTDDGGVTRGSYLATQTFARENVGSTYTCEAYNQLDPRISITAGAIVSVSYPPRQFSVTAPGTPFVVNSSSTGHFVKIKGGSTGKVICAVDSSPSVQVKAESATDLTGIANLKSAAGSATIEILKYTNGKDFSVTCSTAGTTVISTTIQFSISRETTDPGNTGTDTSGNDNGLWIALGCVGGVIALLLIVLLVFCLVRKKPTNANAKQKQKQKASAVPPAGQTQVRVKEDPLTPMQGARLQSGAVEDEWQKEFMVEGMLENVAGNRKPIVDPMAQSMFEYLGENLLSLPYGQPQMQTQMQMEMPMEVAPDYYGNQNVDQAGYQYEADQQTY